MTRAYKKRRAELDITIAVLKALKEDVIMRKSHLRQKVQTENRLLESILRQLSDAKTIKKVEAGAYMYQGLVKPRWSYSVTPKTFEVLEQYERLSERLMGGAGL